MLVGYEFINWYLVFCHELLWCMAMCLFFFNDTATTEIYTLSLHDALPISPPSVGVRPIQSVRGKGMRFYLFNTIWLFCSLLQNIIETEIWSNIATKSAIPGRGQYQIFHALLEFMWLRWVASQWFFDSWDSSHFSEISFFYCRSRLLLYGHIY